MSKPIQCDGETFYNVDQRYPLDNHDMTSDNGGQWWHLHAVTSLKASSSQPSSTCSGYSRGNPRSGSPGLDDGNTISVSLPPEGIIFGAGARRRRNQ
jgi:hypothetical protein